MGRLVKGCIESSTDTLIGDDDRQKNNSNGNTTIKDTKALSEPANPSSQPPQQHQKTNGLKSDNAGHSPPSNNAHPTYLPQPLPPGPLLSGHESYPSSVASRELLGTRLRCRDPIDSDGLVAHNNHVQERLVEIILKHRSEMQTLKRDLILARSALRRSGASGQGGHGGGAKGHGIERPDSAGHMTGSSNDLDESSGIQTGSAGSDASSWEAVDERETKPTLWVPDHAMAECTR